MAGKKINKTSLKGYLEELYERYHRPEFIKIDPLLCVRRFSENYTWEVDLVEIQHQIYRSRQIIAVFT